MSAAMCPAAHKSRESQTTPILGEFRDLSAGGMTGQSVAMGSMPHRRTSSGSAAIFAAGIWMLTEIIRIVRGGFPPVQLSLTLVAFVILPFAVLKTKTEMDIIGGGNTEKTVFWMASVLAETGFVVFGIVTLRVAVFRPWTGIVLILAAVSFGALSLRLR